jgi:hypothetical protein
MEGKIEVIGWKNGKNAGYLPGSSFVPKVGNPI